MLVRDLVEQQRWWLLRTERALMREEGVFLAKAVIEKGEGVSSVTSKYLNVCFRGIRDCCTGVVEEDRLIGKFKQAVVKKHSWVLVGCATFYNRK